MSIYQEEKQSVYNATMALYKAGLIRLSAGNISQRTYDGNIAITPSGLPYDVMSVDDIVIIDLESKIIEGELKPSSEVPMHTAIYKSIKEVNAIVHTHSIYAITFAVAGQPLEPVCVEGLAARGTVPVAQYAAPGSTKAGEVVLDELRKQPGLRAVLLRNHGLVVVAADMETAWQTAYKVELQAQIILQARILGTPTALTNEQIEEIYQIYRNIKR
jgi:L-ribulose-5-phosphate 4-epimerase